VNTSRGTIEIVVLGICVLCTLVLLVSSIHQQSLTGDGAYHVLAGHQALRYGTNTANLEHPPLAKLLMAIPFVLEEEPLAPPVRVSEALEAAAEIHTNPELLFRGVTRARYLVLFLLVGPLLAATYALGRRHGSSRAAWLLVIMVGVSFSTLPTLTILQTDAAVALGFLLTLLAGDTLRRDPQPRNAMLLGFSFGLALSVKFSAVLLAPVVAMATLWACHARKSWRTAMLLVLIVAASSVVVVELSYALANTRYDSAAGRESLRSYCRGRATLVTEDRLRELEPTVLALEEIHPPLAQWLIGFVGVTVQNSIGVYASYAFGDIRPSGRWWYFPVLLVTRTPVVILIGAVAAVVGLIRRRARDGTTRTELSRVVWLEILIVAPYLAVAMTSSYNLGIRHLLPITPVVYLPVVLALSRTRWAPPVVAAALVIESVIVAPLWMCATNTWWLGRLNPTRFAFGAGNMEYRQNMIQLARAMRRRGIEELAVAHPTLDARVLYAYLPSARLVDPGDDVRPGWYVVNVMVEQYVPAVLSADLDPALVRLAKAWQPTWSAIRAGEDHGYVAGTFHLYRVR
jgi:hypothetical protein